MAGSAKWRSSTTSTVGMFRARATSTSRQAASISPALTGRPGRPASGPSSSASRSTSGAATTSASALDSRSRAVASSSVSRTSACALTMWVSAVYGPFSLYGRHRPSRQRTSTSGLPCMRRAISRSSRLLPTPCTPTMEISRASCSRTLRTSAEAIRSSSWLRPASGIVSSSSSIRPASPSASHTVSGCDLPLRVTVRGGSAYRMEPRVARRVAAETSTPPSGASVCSRAAVATTSPETIASPALCAAARSTSASPVATPTRMRMRYRPASGWSSSSRWTSSPAATARTASCSLSTGTPNTAITASPTYFSRIPPYRRTTVLAVAK